MFAALASLPLTTAYSVLFDRVVSVRIVLRKALQYGLARYSIVALTLIPFGGLVLFMAQHRNESLISLLTGARRPAVLGSLAGVGVLALRLRPRLLAGLDRRYFREPFDAGRILERLMGPSAASVSDLGVCLSEEVGRAFHARVSVLLIDDTHTVLRDAEARLQPLSAMTPLMALADRADQAVDIGAAASRPWLDTLPEHERRWLAVGGVSVIAPIWSHELGPVGLVALTSRLSELPYSDEDRRFLAAVAAAAGLAFDRFHPRARSAAVPSEPPALECERCFSVYAAEARRCLCGASLVEAPVPHVLRGVFRFEQRIASGSMGVVYRAVDLGLGRNVAIKTLPGVTGERRAAFVQEARAMARVTHANLAVVHGVETWRGVSFLVQEYLENGTLARRLFTSRLAVADAIDLGLLLADLLEHLHRYDLIHCDIKPSNIGYTAEDAVKLFDFGLAQRVEDRDVAGSGESSSAFVGTPVYMSPEAIRGEAPSPGVDLWALSVVLYEAIAGRRPFDGATTPDVLAAILRGSPPRLTELAPDTPESVASFFDKALSRDRAARPASANALGRALGELRRALAFPSHASGKARAADAYEVRT
jgi:GAF domain-containing protein